MDPIQTTSPTKAKTVTKRAPSAKPIAKKAVVAKPATGAAAKKKTPAKAPIKSVTAKSAQKPAKPPVKKTASPSTSNHTEVVKAKKSKIVRDSFTIPKDEYQAIHALKMRSAKIGLPAKKSELLRAGIKVLTLLSDSAFEKAIAQIPLIKTGRPQKS